MTTQYDRMQAASRELLDAYHAGREVDPHALEWARWAQRQQPRKMPQRPAIHVDRILAVLNGPSFPIEGYFASEISTISTVPAHACAKVLHRLHTDGRIAMIKIPGRSRFFPSEHALQMGRRLVEADEERRQEAKKKKPKVAAPNAFNSRPVVEKRRAPAPHQQLLLRAKPLATPAPATGSVFIPPVIPDNVKITRIERQLGRYEVPANTHGAGFLDEWRAKRGEKQS